MRLAVYISNILMGKRARRYGLEISDNNGQWHRCSSNLADDSSPQA